MCLLLAGVDFMAGPTGSSLYFIINVEKVKVPFPVTKIGQGGSFCLKKRVLGVTLKAQGVFAQVKRGVEPLGIVTGKLTEQVGSVWTVAGSAIVLLHRAVFMRIFLQHLRYVLQYYSIAVLHPFVVAGKAQLSHLIYK
jgi:hypothetical protein